ncbi:50S ribosomal protein L1 [Candidatus Woesearchaeota archaeon]|nr:50S ribosomal protein L1 [Candidatus Woesearchaeota archaeon]
MAVVKEDILAAIAGVRKSEKRGFSQSVDLVVPLTGLDLKKPEHQVDFFIELPSGTGKKARVCALIGPELQPEAKSACDGMVLQEDFANYGKNRKLTKKLVKQFDFFLGQANIMPQIAATFGRVLGPKGKMPNPKAGCIVPPKAALKPLVERLQKMIHVAAKVVPMVQCRVGSESMSDDALAANALAVYDQLVHALPGGDQNVKAAYLKLTMGAPVRIIAAKAAAGSVKGKAKAAAAATK